MMIIIPAPGAGGQEKLFNELSCTCGIVRGFSVWTGSVSGSPLGTSEGLGSEGYGGCSVPPLWTPASLIGPNARWWRPAAHGTHTAETGREKNGRYSLPWITKCHNVLCDQSVLWSLTVDVWRLQFLFSSCSALFFFSCRSTSSLLSSCRWTSIWNSLKAKKYRNIWFTACP